MKHVTIAIGVLGVLALIPSEVVARPWTLFTFQFIHGGMFWFFISMLVLWIMAKPIESSWGSPRFLVFWLVATFGAVAAALALGRPLAGDAAFMGSLLFTFATLNPEMEFLLFFILPVKVKWLAILGGGAFLIWNQLERGKGWTWVPVLAAAGAVVTRDVPDYALILGVPGRQRGWMSAYGEQLDLPLTGEASVTCPHTGDVYSLSGSVVTRKEVSAS